MAEGAFNTNVLNEKLSLMKMELAKKKLKLEKQKRHTDRKRKLKLSSISNSKHSKSIETEKYEYSVAHPKHSGTENISQFEPNNQVDKNKLYKNSIENYKIDIQSRIFSKTIDNNKSNCKVKLQQEQINSANKISDRDEYGFIEYCDKLFKSDIFLTDFATPTYKTIHLNNENGIVLFCHYLDEVLFIVQRNTLRLYFTNSEGDWLIESEHRRKENLDFCSGFYNNSKCMFIELDKKYEATVKLLIVLYDTKSWEEKCILLSGPISSLTPVVLTQCFSDTHVAVCYKLGTDLESCILCLDIDEMRTNIVSETKSNATYLHFLMPHPGYKDKLLLVCCKGACSIYSSSGICLQSYELPFLADPCLSVKLEKNILFLVAKNKVKKAFVLVALNLLTKQHKVLQIYRLTSESVADMLVFKDRQLVALNNNSVTTWDIKTGEISSTWCTAKPETVLFQNGVVFTVNSKEANLSWFTLV